MAKKRSKFAKSSRQGWVYLDSEDVSWSLPQANLADGEVVRQTPTADILAYTGKQVDVGWGHDAIFELSGISYNQRIPLLFEHRRTNPVGHSDNIETTERGIEVHGHISAVEASPEADLIAATGSRGYPWQASVGLLTKKVEFLREKEKAVVNGHQLKGPIYVVRQSRLGEVSLVSLGADDDTSSSIAATQGGFKMTFREWVQANHPDTNLDELDDNEVFEMMTEWRQATSQTPPAASTTSRPPVPRVHENGSDEAPDPYLEEFARARARTAHIERLCGVHSDICASILTDESHGRTWTDEQITNRCQLADLQNGRPQVPGRGISQPSIGRNVIEAAMMLSFGEQVVSQDRLVRWYGEKIVEAAERYRGIGLRGAVELLAESTGQRMPTYSSGGDRQWVEAAVTLIDLPNMFQSTAQRTLDALYESMPPLGPQVCRNGSVPDFRKVTRFRLDGGQYWKPVGRDGRLESTAYADEQPFEVWVETYGEILSFRREDRINDDLGAIPQVTELMARGALYTIDRSFGQQLYARANYGVGGTLGTYNPGAAEAFSYGALDVAWDRLTNFKKNTTRHHKLTKRIRPEFIINGIALEKGVDRVLNPARFAAVATVARASAALGDADLVNEENYFNRRLRAFTFDEMDNDTWFSGSGDATYYPADEDSWWLLPGPTSRYAPLEFAWLNGRRTPVIESEPGPFENLNFMLRGYIDTRCNALDFKGVQLMQPQQS